MLMDSMRRSAWAHHHEGHHEARGPAAVVTERDHYATLPLYRYRAVLRPRRELILAGVRMGAMLRGTFGTTLRGLVCHDLQLGCGKCAQRKVCPYPAVFDPAATANELSLKVSSSPPRPFVVRPARTIVPDRIPAGAELALDLHLVGRAQRQAPYLIAALVRLASDGLGAARVPLELDRVDELDVRGGTCIVPSNGTSKTSMWPGPGLALRARELARHGDTKASGVHVRFLTPTLLHQGGDAAGTRVPTFGTLVRHLHARLSALAALFGDSPLGDDRRELVEAADRIEMHTANVRVARKEQHARRSRLPAVLGLVGEARYVGDLAPFMPLLRLGELLHVGENASFGLGRIQVEAD